MQLAKQHAHDHESETEEGFIQSKHIVHEKKHIYLKKQSIKSQPKKQFVSRHILQGIMRKQPQECYKRFSKFDFVEQPHGKGQKIKNQFLQDELNSEKKNQRITNQNFLSTKTEKLISEPKQKSSTPYDKFIGTGDYILVYSRSKDFKFTNEEPNFANNYVRLDCIRSGEDTKYKAIKPFQVIEQKRDESMTQSFYKNGSFRQTNLQFDSKFECGNLLCAFKHKKEPYTYSLLMHNDSNTYGYNHWFYFSVKNAQVGIKYQFNIVNFRKRHSFFKQGNKLVIFSYKDSRKEGMSGYSKRGQNIKYGKSPIIKSYESKEKFFQLSFNLMFQNDNDLYYISTGLPYSYSRLLKNLGIYEQLARENDVHWSLQSVGTSIGGNSIPYLTITKFQDLSQLNIKTSKSYCESTNAYNNDFEQEYKSRRKTKNIYSEIQNSPKRVIFLTARQHPGETWSSYLMEEFIYSLVSQSTPETKYLLQHFIIKCVPMINVDGVISGNFRCDLTGMDLNRNWKTPSDILHPQIFSIKNQIINLTYKGYQIQTYFDLHGHSKEYNLFCYSCKTDNYDCRLMPYIFSQLNEDFRFNLCTFGISRYKQTTARVVVFNIIKNTNVLTIESSFFGSQTNGKVKIFEPQSMKRMAETMIKGCKSYFSHDQRYHKCKQIIRERISEFLNYKGEYSNCAFSGSDSQPSGDQIELNEKLQRILPKNLIKECEEFASMKKPTNKGKRKQKKQRTLNKQEKNKNKKQQPSQTQIKTIESQKNDSPIKTVASNWEAIIIKKSQPAENFTSTNFKHRSFIMSNKKIDESDLQVYRDLIDRQDHRLSFFTRQRHDVMPLKLNNQSSQIFKDAYNATEKKIKPRYDLNLDDIKQQRRFTNRKLTMYRDGGKKSCEKDQFPLLCIMSQNKKKKHIEIMHTRIQEAVDRSASNNGGPSSKIKTAVQTRTQAIKQLRQRNKNNVDLVSKIWRDNYNKYGMAYSAFRIQQ